jgi:hypothetical protein
MHGNVHVWFGGRLKKARFIGTSLGSPPYARHLVGVSVPALVCSLSGVLVAAAP